MAVMISALCSACIINVTISCARFKEEEAYGRARVEIVEAHLNGQRDGPRFFRHLCDTVEKPAGEERVR